MLIVNLFSSSLQTLYEENFSNHCSSSLAENGMEAYQAYQVISGISIVALGLYSVMKNSDVEFTKFRQSVAFIAIGGLLPVFSSRENFQDMGGCLLAIGGLALVLSLVKPALRQGRLRQQQLLAAQPPQR